MKKSVLKNCAIYQMLKNNKKHLSFHTPGHKKGKWDITELVFSDNLSSPKGCILQAEKDIATLLGAQRSLLVTDGSTAGVHAILYAAKSVGAKKIALCSPAHKSLYTGAEILGLELIFCDIEDKESIKKADAVFITSPDYNGNIPNLQNLKNLCQENGKYLLIDGAHGGHLRFDETLYAGAYADLWVDGVHKSLPALTQGAVVSSNNEKLTPALLKGADIFRTTSPSYPIMASIEYAVKYPRNEKLEKAVRLWASEEKRITVNKDWTKVCAYFGKHAFAVEKELEKRGVYAEFCDGENILFYLSPCVKTTAFKKLKKLLTKLFVKYPESTKKAIQRNPAPFVLGEEVEKEWVKIEDSVGRVCAGACGLFPPCTPLIFAGEVITKEKIELLQTANHCFGVIDQKISVVKEQK